MKTNKKSGKSKSSDKVKNKKARLAERAAKREARKGDGSFPDIMIITKERLEGKSEKGDKKYFFAAHDGGTMSTLYDNDQVVGVYKLRRVSKVAITRKIVR